MRNIPLLLLLWLLSYSLYAQQQITLSDIYLKGAFYQERIYGINWMKDGQFYSSLEGSDIVKYDVTTGERVATILKGSELKPSIGIVDYSFSADEQKILLMTEQEYIYRRSYSAEFYIYDLTTKKLQKLSNGGKQAYASFSPDGSKVGFTRKNNLFYVDLASMKEVQITTDGKFNHIINGSADWVYEEELYLTKAFEWSPDGQKIAYYTFDESQVKEYNVQKWNEGELYPEDYKFKYPKAGEANSEVKISIYDLASKKITPVDIGTEKDIYIPRINWTMDANVLSVRRMNRLQNKLEILHADANTGATTVILTEESKTYIDITFCDDLTYLKDGEHFIYTSEKSGFKHIYLYKTTGELVNQITSGNWEVAEFLGINENSKKPYIYYTSTEVSPLERHLYSIDIKGKKKTKLTPQKGTNEIIMSGDLKYYILTNSSIDKPVNVSLYKTEKNELIKLLIDNADFAERMKSLGVSPKEFFQFTTSNGDQLNGYMIKPTDFDATKQYPVLMFQYSGPNSQMVLDNWGGSSFEWHQILAQKGYIIAVVDGRGTGGRGRDFAHVTYGELGKYEVIDQIETGKYLGNLAYVDKNRIGIWGWSYGGYMSSLCIMKGADVFKTAIAVAPVTTWRFYDTIYTERYLKTPQDNARGYDENSPIHHVSKLKGNFLLVHGTGDDNVHFQNAVILQNALIKAGKQFESFYYPDKAHGISGVETRMHLFEMMTQFIMNNL